VLYTVRQEVPEAVTRRDVVPTPGASVVVGSLREAIGRWEAERPERAVIEIADSSVYSENVKIHCGKGQSLEIRAAAEGCRPVLRTVDTEGDSTDDAPTFRGEAGAGSLVLDGLLVAGSGAAIRGGFRDVTLRHCTFVPGWDLTDKCEPVHAEKPSLWLEGLDGPVFVRHCILGTIQVVQDEVRTDPMRLEITDSVVDATSPDLEAIGSCGNPRAHVALCVARTTVVGFTEVQSIPRAETAIFDGTVLVTQRQAGCMRFCYLRPGDPLRRPSRTPPRYECQPDAAVAAALRDLPAGADPAAAEASATRRVVPRFVSRRYGHPRYLQLAANCPTEIAEGAEDRAEMGVYHDLFQPQRLANLRARVAEFIPADALAAVLVES
jgi:hypothetical protein